MTANVSITRLYVLRAMYLLNCLLVGSGVCAQFLQRSQPWDPIRGVAFSFLGALAILSAVGLRYPLAMLPVIFMQLCYKALWLAAVYLPLRAVGRSTDLVQSMLIGALLDVIAIPWGYVLARYVRAPGDQWRRGSVRPAAQQPDAPDEVRDGTLPRHSQVIRVFDGHSRDRGITDSGG